MKHNPKVVMAFFDSYSIPRPELEYGFHATRKWRFDMAWDYHVFRLALEIEGGVWTGGRHTSGAGFVKDMEKYNEAAAIGWRVIRVQPKFLLTKDTALLIKRCLGLL